jgi:mRNA interferase RelE/StbE
MSTHAVYIRPAGLREIKDLPGHVRQRIKRAIDGFADNPRPSHSQALDMPEDLTFHVWRLRVDKWRIVYVITDEDNTVDVLAVRKRPPYDYGDLASLIAEIK